MFLLYDLVFLLYALIYLPYLLITRRLYLGFGMRFGLFSPTIKPKIKAKANIWVHAVSVGEVMVIDGFIDHLRKSYPAYQIIITVTTKTGYALAQERLNGKALVLPSPIDFSFVAGSFVSLINPKMYIVVETEIWPNLYRKLYLKKVPIAVINGRISDTSFGRYKAIRALLKGILAQVSVWCMQSPRDADRIRELGAEASRVFVTGNVKFDDLPKPLDTSISDLVSNKEELWWVAGSTHPGEEDILLDAYDKVIKDNPHWRLIIVPRHIERAGQVMELVARHGRKAVKFSELNKEIRYSENAVVVVDTIGQLRSLYGIASMVFVGKSLCVGGGQNVIEPAYYGKAIVIGPRVENFRDVVACFKEGQGIVQVQDAHAFEIAVRELCADDLKRKTLGDAAVAVITANQGATRRSLERLAGLLK